jgi:hypothetical protein
MEMAEEYGLNCRGENDDDDEGNATAPPAPVPPAVAPEVIIEEEAHMEIVPEQEAPMAHEMNLADAEP